MLMLKKTIAALSLLSILAACQNDENPSQPEPKPRQDINLTRAEQEFMDKGTDFAFRFFDQGNVHRLPELKVNISMLDLLLVSYCGIAAHRSKSISARSFLFFTYGVTQELNT